MSFTQFAQSMSIIRRAEHRRRPEAVLRHLYFQLRKLRFPRPLTLRLSESRISDNEPGGVISMVNMLGMYDYNNMNLVRKALQTGGVMFDVGANIGSYSLIASEQAGARVIALEPNPRAYAKLKRNLQLNKRSNVEALQLGASAAPGRLVMTDLPKTVLNHVVAGVESGPETIEVEVTTLDRLCMERDVRPTVLKLDVEGHEPAVLAGAPSCLATVDLVVIENAERPEIVQHMHSHKLAGPYYYHHRSRTMRHHPQRLPEDGVFVGAGFARLLPDIALPTTQRATAEKVL